MERKINIYLYKIPCNYTRQGIISILRENISSNVRINFDSCIINGDSLVITKGNFTPFTTPDDKFIVIPERISIDTFLDIIINFKHGRISDEVKSISLGNRELEILSGIISEKSDDEISKLMRIQKKTVSSHKDNIKRKISANSKIDLFYAFSVFNFNDHKMRINETEIMQNRNMQNKKIIVIALISTCKIKIAKERDFLAIFTGDNKTAKHNILNGL